MLTAKGVAAQLGVVFLSVQSSSAQVFTDRAAFLAALSGTATETFESTSGPGIGSSPVSALALSAFSLQSTPAAIKIAGENDGFGSFNTTPGGRRYLYLDTDVGLQGSATTFTFAVPTRAIGFDYTGVTQGGNAFTVLFGGQIYSLSNNPSNETALFFGVISPGRTSTAVLTTTSDSGYGVDQVSFVVPEPMTLAALALPLARRQRRI